MNLAIDIAIKNRGPCLRFKTKGPATGDNVVLRPLAGAFGAYFSALGFSSQPEPRLCGRTFAVSNYAAQRGMCLAGNPPSFNRREVHGDAGSKDGPP